LPDLPAHGAALYFHHAWTSHDRHATVKRFYPEGDAIRLQPANAAMAPLRYPAGQVQIQGAVIGLMRRY